jgi:CRP-like cAMP-binding protein
MHVEMRASGGSADQSERGFGGEVRRTPETVQALPLREMLGVRRPEPLDESDEISLDVEAEMPGIYEISLDEEEVAIEFERAAVATPPLMRVDETDFGGLTDDADFSEIAASPAPRAALPKIPLFSSLAEEDLRELIERMELHDVAAGQPVVKEGDRGGSLYVLASGEARVTVGGVEVARLPAGAFFGEVGLFTDDPRTATVEAASDCAVLELRRELAWELARRSPEVLRTLVSFLRDRLLERLLTGSPLFAELAPPDARALAAEFIFLELDAGATPVKQGERSPGMFFLMSGVAEVVRDGEHLAELRAGEVFGERSLLLRAPASADVRAMQRCWALLLPRDRFQEIMLSYPQVLAYVSELADARGALTAHGEATERRIQLS